MYPIIELIKYWILEIGILIYDNVLMVSVNLFFILLILFLLSQVSIINSITKSILSLVYNLLKPLLDISIEKYKSDLRIIEEGRKLEYSKDLEKHSIFVEKRWSAYLEVFEKLDDIYGLLSEFSSFGSKPLTFEDRNENDFKKMLEKSNFPEKKTNDLLSLFKNESTRKSAIQKYYDYLKIQKCSILETKYHELRNFTDKKNFLFSKDFLGILDELYVKILSEAISCIEMVSGVYGGGLDWQTESGFLDKIRESTKQTKLRIDKLNEIARKTFSID